MFFALLSGLALAQQPAIVQVDLPNVRVTLVGTWPEGLPVVADSSDRACAISVFGQGLEPLKAFECTDALFAKVAGMTGDWSVRTSTFTPPVEVARLTFLFPTATDPAQGIFVAPTAPDRLGIWTHPELERVYPDRSCGWTPTARVPPEAEWCTVTGTEDWFGIPIWTAASGCAPERHAAAIATANRERRPHCAWGADGVPRVRGAETAAALPPAVPVANPEVK